MHQLIREGSKHLGIVQSTVIAFRRFIGFAQQSVVVTEKQVRDRAPGIQFQQAIEIGYREVTDVEVAAIAKALGVAIAWLFGEGENG